MPTFETPDDFVRQYNRLSPAEQEAFKLAVKKFVADLKAGGGFRKGLRVKGVRGATGIFEMTWAGDGRATFSYGAEKREGEAHIIWSAIGGHDVLP